MKTYWNNLNERERWMLAGVAVFIVLYLMYLLIYAPLKQAIHDKSQQLVEKQETLVWMQQVAKQYKAKKAPENLSSSQLLTVLASQLSNTSFKQFTYQLQQTGTSDIQLVFDKVPYNLFVAWLWTISEKYAISIKQFNVEKTDTPGVVKMMIVINSPKG